MTQNPHPLFDLRSFSDEQLFYEAWMFVWTREALRDLDVQLQARNALIESGVLHLRNLLDFFYPPVDAGQRVLASHYVSEWDPSSTPRTALLEAQSRCHRELAPLSRPVEGNTVRDQPWDFDQISAELRFTIARFVEGGRHALSDRAISALEAI